MTKHTNLKFQFALKQQRSEFGGSLLGKSSQSHAKGRRPFSSKRPMHVVMRSSLATGEYSFRDRKRSSRVRDIIHNQAKSSGVRIYRYANSGNHLHLLLLTKSKEALSRFLKATTGLLARLVLGCQKGRSLPKGVTFWDQRPFSRIVHWGREYTAVARYLLKNTLEALGFIEYDRRSVVRQLARRNYQPHASTAKRLV